MGKKKGKGDADVKACRETVKKPKLRQKPKEKKKDRRPPNALTPTVGFKFAATVSRPQRIMLILAWAKNTGSVRIDGVTYDTPDGWVDGWLLCHRTVGGPSGDRRIRQLRLDPGGIEKRTRTVNGDTIIEYRFADRPERLTSKTVEGAR